ncbi:hypothetical protein PCANC_11570 [Puccinia coronata f. sp. avenae]|uniref:Pru domain-containing protein n=1 Tax=Puccinia coronata f. sp. avenae TaxID=200324 RepID=A0A2N5V7U4_9BASI|nr:hypothetical protein PCASD_25423 [Puccinia coronata f. sp. avenae]PLW30706.1 hypothetical protein PCASD_20138 [Puccinia coronata f. sp. avenae]PLW46079.1 hypothetical protein PCANC_11570 [Puccinia coronata f. sp. avenae]
MTRLFQFRAGRCERRGETNIVDPLPSRGLLYVEHNEEDGVLNHLCYKDLESGAVIDDFIIFAGDASFQKVLVPDSATARVYALCFSSSNQKLLYWMQDPDPTTDAANVGRLNELIVDDGQMSMEYPDTVEESNSSSQADSGAVSNIPQGVSVEQMNQLQSIIAGFGQSSSSIDQAGYRLGDILNMEAIEPILNDPEILSSLESYLPSGIKANTDSIGQVVRSADFKAAVDSFDIALRELASGNQDDGLRMFLLHGLGLNPAQCEGVDGYVKMVLNLSNNPK